MWGHIFNLENPLIGADNTWILWAICALGVAIAIYLEQKYQWAAKLTGAIVALIFAVVLSNAGIIPMDAPVWDAIWSYIVPLSLPLLLLQCDIRKIGKESGRILIVFLFGSVGTTCGALIGFALLNKYIPELSAIAGVYTGSYIGGGPNFAALNAAFHVSGNMISASVVSDNLLMVLYFFALIAIPSIKFFRKHYPHPYVDEVESTVVKDITKTQSGNFWSGKEISLKDIAFCAATAFSIVAISITIGGVFESIIPAEGTVLTILNTLLKNQYLWITTLSMICATAAPKFFGNIKGSQEIGTFLIYMFFFVIGVPASIPMIIMHSPLLLLFAAIVVLTNMTFSFGLGKLFKFNLEDIILASNANIGGPTTAVAMAISKGWTKLVGPILLVGTLGYVIGTYAGLIVGSILGM